MQGDGRVSAGPRRGIGKGVYEGVSLSIFFIIKTHSLGD